jgi:hypothetical protein
MIFVSCPAVLPLRNLLLVLGMRSAIGGSRTAAIEFNSRSLGICSPVAASRSAIDVPPGLRRGTATEDPNSGGHRGNFYNVLAASEQKGRRGDADRDRGGACGLRK